MEQSIVMDPKGNILVVDNKFLFLNESLINALRHVQKSVIEVSKWVFLSIIEISEEVSEKVKDLISNSSFVNIVETYEEKKDYFLEIALLSLQAPSIESDISNGNGNGNTKINARRGFWPR